MNLKNIRCVDPLAISREHCNEASGSIKVREFLDPLSDSNLMKDSDASRVLPSS
jgi:hypothetical protein